MTQFLPIRYVTLDAYSASGYTVKAMQEKISKGIWCQGKEYRKAPDGRILVDILGVEKWVEKGLA